MFGRRGGKNITIIKLLSGSKIVNRRASPPFLVAGMIGHHLADVFVS